MTSRMSEKGGSSVLRSFFLPTPGEKPDGYDASDKKERRTDDDENPGVFAEEFQERGSLWDDDTSVIRNECDKPVNFLVRFDITQLVGKGGHIFLVIFQTVDLFRKNSILLFYSVDFRDCSIDLVLNITSGDQAVVAQEEDVEEGAQNDDDEDGLVSVEGGDFHFLQCREREEIRGPALAGPRKDSLLLVECILAGIDGGRTEFFFDSEKLVVFGDTVAA